MIDIAVQLVGWGVAFEIGTLSPTQTPAQSTPQTQLQALTVPRIAKQTFNLAEYGQYMHHRDIFLRSPRGALALRSGGILAYLASTVLTPLDVCKGNLRGRPLTMSSNSLWSCHCLGRFTPALMPCVARRGTTSVVKSRALLMRPLSSTGRRKRPS